MRFIVEMSLLCTFTLLKLPISKVDMRYTSYKLFEIIIRLLIITMSLLKNGHKKFLCK